MRIAIVGGGCGGVLAALAIVEVTRKPTEILIFEPSDRLGRGVAYATSEPFHLLNVPAARMSAYSSAPRHFLEWLRRKEPRTGEGAFIPRGVYGEYLESALAEAVQASRYAELRWVRDSVSAVSRVEGSFSLVAGTSSYRAETVVLSIGVPEVVLPHVFSSIGITSSPMITRDPWKQGISICNESTHPLLLIGTGLTAVDLALSASVRGFKGKILMLSRHGLLPTTHEPSPPIEPLRLSKHDTSTPLRALRTIRRIAAEHPWRGVIDALRPLTTQIWRSWARKQRSMFLRHLKSYWEVHRHRMAPTVAGELDRLRSSGQLEVLSGRIVGLRQMVDGVGVAIKPRMQAQSSEVVCGQIINCTGFGPLTRHSFHGLLGELVQEGLLEISEDGLGARTPDGGPSASVKGLYVLGALLRGERWESTAVPELRQQAAEIASHIVANRLALDGDGGAA